MDFKKFFAVIMLIAFIFTQPAFAGIVVYEDAVQKGAVEKLNFSTGLDVSVDHKTATISSNLSSTLTTNAIDAANSIWFGSNAIYFEGATADAFETRILSADVTADADITLPNQTGTLVASTLSTNNVDAANSAWFESGALVFEGPTADGFEGRITASDWTADRVHTLPDMTGAFFMSTLATNNFDVANSVWAVSNGISFEGATADAFETTLTSADATADQNATLPNFAVNYSLIGSTLTTNNFDTANSIWMESNTLAFEGATADGFETRIVPADPLADETLTLPNTTGAVGTFEVKGTTVVITAGASPTLTVPVGVDFIATDTIITDNQDQTITFSSGGTVGQECQVVFQTDSGGSNDEVITFQTTLTNTTGTLTLANLTANRYVVNFKSDGTVWNEVSRTGAQT